MSRVSSRAVFALCLAGLGALPLFAAPAAPPPAVAKGPVLADLARPLLHQSPTDAVLLVRRVLTPIGTVEIQGKRVVVRDVPSVIGRLRTMLDDFDHPRVELRVVVQVVQASGPAAFSPQEGSSVPEPMLGRLRQAFRYSDYRMVAQGGFEVAEGTDVSSPIGQDFPVSFRLGTLQHGQSVWLHDFQLRRIHGPGEDQGLLDTNLVLSLDHPLVVGLTNDESSKRALLVIINCTRAMPPAVP